MKYKDKLEELRNLFLEIYERDNMEYAYFKNCPDTTLIYHAVNLAIKRLKELIEEDRRG